MSEDIPAKLRSLVRQRAGGRCEYCLVHEDDAWEPYEADHAVAVKHGGLTTEDNLVWSCTQCNKAKGGDVASIDQDTGRVIRLFHPRRDVWSRHFQLDGARILPRTKVGRATVFLLRLDHFSRVRVRRLLVLRGRYPR